MGSLGKRVLPGWAYHGLKTAHDLLLKRGAYDFRIRRDRASPTDYTTEWEQKNSRRLKASILWYEDWEEETENNLDVLQRLDLIHHGQIVLDYGVRIGRIAKRLLENYEVKIIGVDRSRSMLEEARRYIPSKFFSTGRMELLSDQEFLAGVKSFEGKIDLILFLLVLEHIPEPVLDDLFPGLLRCLPADGQIFVFGNEVLDVDSEGNLCAKRIETFLRKHIDLMRTDIWKGIEVGGRYRDFRFPRFSFLGQAKFTM